ncbi:MAG: MBL fold metallo-hydrolase [Verrucomicrobia bacterium]|nr:MBL fold metallo-hydrolase [Verrucomicrobiota bacterium]
MLAITFLGTGTSMGVPMIRCGCDVCRSKDPRDNRTRSSIFVQAQDRSWIVDTGPEFRIQALREHIESIDAVLYSHAHADHVMGFDDLRRFQTAARPTIPVYASIETMQHLERVFAYAFSPKFHFPGYLRPERHVIDGPFTLGKTEIHPIPSEHGTAHVFGFLFRQDNRSIAAYLSDCKTVYPKGVETLQGVETLILGTPCRRSHPTHMNLAEGVAFARSLNARQAYFTHLSHDFAHSATEKELPDNAFLAYDGLRLDL